MTLAKRNPLKLVASVGGAAVAALMLTTAPSAASDPAERLLNVFDINEDGVLDAEETARAQIPTDEVDQNEDGLITLAELREGIVFTGPLIMPSDTPLSLAEVATGVIVRSYTKEDRLAISERLFATLDRDGDGKLTAAEISPDAPDRAPLENMDANGDGFVDLEELRAKFSIASPLPEDQQRQ